MSTIERRLAVSDPDRLAGELADFIDESVRSTGRAGCVLGNSGGVDSALAAALAVRALGRDNVHLYFLPERDSDPKTRADAALVARHFGLPMVTLNITPVLRKLGVYRQAPWAVLFPHSVRSRYNSSVHEKRAGSSRSSLLNRISTGAPPGYFTTHAADMSAKTRVRMAVLYRFAESLNCLVMGTNNRSEKMSGLFVRYGDAACDLNPLESLFKTQIFALAEAVGVPRRIIDKAPSGDLIPGVNDHGLLRMDYGALDVILAGLDLGLDDGEIVAAGASTEDIAYVRSLAAEAAGFARLPLVP